MNIFKKFPYIVIEGPIGCGKSTLAKLLSNKYGANMFTEKADRNPFLPKFYEDMKHYALSTQLFFNNLFDNDQLEIFKYSGLKNSKILSIINITAFVLGIFIIFFFIIYPLMLKVFIFS